LQSSHSCLPWDQSTTSSAVPYISAKELSTPVTKQIIHRVDLNKRNYEMFRLTWKRYALNPSTIKSKLQTNPCKVRIYQCAQRYLQLFVCSAHKLRTHEYCLYYQMCPFKWHGRKVSLQMGNKQQCAYAF
jgi:hypothetical protein